MKLMKEAEEKAASRWPPWGGNERKETACEMLAKAAAQFKIAKEWEMAAKCYIKAGDLHTSLKSDLESANSYAEAAKAYKNSSVANGEKEAVRLFTISAGVHAEANRISLAAKTWRAIAELEEKMNDLKEAAEAYSKAAGMFYATDANSDGHGATLKVAEFAAMAGEYDKAIEKFDAVSVASLENRLLTYSVKDYMFRAMLCRLAKEASSSAPEFDSVSNAVEKYKEQHPAMDGARETKLVEGTLAACREDNADKVADLCAQYDRIYRLDRLCTHLLTVIKRTLHGGGGQHVSKRNGEDDLQGTGRVTDDLQGSHTGSTKDRGVTKSPSNVAARAASPTKTASATPHGATAHSSAAPASGTGHASAKQTAGDDEPDLA